jgi:hypothetical protein
VNPLDHPDSPRGVRWLLGQPYASLLVCMTCIALQTVSWFFIVLIILEFDGNEAAEKAMYLLAVPFFLIPAGALYGIYLARPSSGYDRPGGWLRGVGLLANILYLMIGIFVWFILLSGVRV